MSHIYDCWEKLVDAVLLREQYLYLCTLSDAPSEASSCSSYQSSSYQDSSDDDDDDDRTVYKITRHYETGLPRLAEKQVVDEQDVVERVSKWTESFQNLDLSAKETDFFKGYEEMNSYKVQEVIGEGSSGVVFSAFDARTGEKVAIKRINFENKSVSDATEILREIKLLRLLSHPDIVKIKHIMLPPSRREFQEIYVVFEWTDSDLHQVIELNDDLTRDHHQFFLYQLLRCLKYIHSAHVIHRNLKPKNVLADVDCKLKICDFGLARTSFPDPRTPVFFTDYVATMQWYLAPELCGSFFSKYTPANDMWSIGCIFAEMFARKPLFPGKNVVHQLDLMTDLLGTPRTDYIARIRNAKARRYLSSMRKKQPVALMKKFPNADPSALRLLSRLLAFDPLDRPTAEEALADPYFKNLANSAREPSTEPISELEFEFERRVLGNKDIRELIYQEILEYHPQGDSYART